MFDQNSLVLVIDDMKTMRKIVIKTLTEIGYKNFMEAQDGAEGWKVLSDNVGKIGLVVSDWNMPNATGLDLLKRVRADGRLKTMPFILLTAESEGSQVSEAVTAGVDSYIVKPFTSQILQEKIQAVQKKKQA